MILIVTEEHDYPPQELTRADWEFGEMVLAEPFIRGKELTCAVIGDGHVANERGVLMV